jgi:hypothetical protein
MYAPYFNLYFYYAVPLILFFCHRFLETGQWRYFFLAGNLLAFQNMGNLLYLLPVTTMIIFFYFVFHGLFHWQKIHNQLRAARWNLAFLASLCGIAVSFYTVFIIKSYGTELITLNRAGRNLDGSVSLDTFLNHSIIRDPGIWMELILGISWNFDTAFYIGLAPLPFIIYGLLLKTSRRSLPLICLIIWILMFSRGTIVSSMLYYAWPLMKFYRHLFNVGIFVKVFLCFLAGFGFEAVFYDSNPRRQSRFFYYMLILLCGMMLWLAFLFFQSGHNEFFLNQFTRQDPFPLISKHLFQQDALTSWLNQSAIWALLCGVLLIAIFIGRAPHILRRLAFLALILQVGNLYGYQWHLTQSRTLALTKDQYQVLAFRPMPFPKQRIRELPTENPRVSLLNALPMRDFYCYLNGFLFIDEISHTYWVTDWLRPLDQLMRTFWGQNRNHRPAHPQDLNPSDILNFPWEHPVAGKIAGFSQDKVQFFAQAYLINNDEDIAALLRHPQYHGDILFLSQDDSPATQDILHWKDGLPLNANQRIPLTYSLLQFTSNRFAVEVDLPEEYPVWMVYSDVWHPFWRAHVNGQQTDVYRANLAYKAVKLSGGHNLVHFYYHAPLFNVVQHINVWHALGWFFLICGLILHCAGIRFGRKT